MSFSDYLENAVLGHVFGSAVLGKPAGLHAALFTAPPTDAGGGTEIAGGAYARQSVVLTVTGNSAANPAPIEFPVASATWGTVSHVGLFDAAVGGNLLVWTLLRDPPSGEPVAKLIAAGDQFRIPAGELRVTLD